MISAALIFSGCAAPIYKPVMLPIPDKPELPTVAGADLMCLSDKTYSRLVNREHALVEYSTQLRGVIEANNRHAD